MEKDRFGSQGWDWAKKNINCGNFRVDNCAWVYQSFLVKASYLDIPDEPLQGWIGEEKSCFN